MKNRIFNTARFSINFAFLAAAIMGSLYIPIDPYLEHSFLHEFGKDPILIIMCLSSATYFSSFIPIYLKSFIGNQENWSEYRKAYKALFKLPIMLLTHAMWSLILATCMLFILRDTATSFESSLNAILGFIVSLMALGLCVVSIAKIIINLKNLFD
tara:strand:+ start:9765 stop:10232 length:468 start_codon:yes stop_codon:yes gene_type:complete